jgi:hypothetical protein
MKTTLKTIALVFVWLFIAVGCFSAEMNNQGKIFTYAIDTLKLKEEPFDSFGNVNPHSYGNYILDSLRAMAYIIVIAKGGPK